MSRYTLRNKEVKKLIKKFVESYKISDLGSFKKSKFRIDCVEVGDKRIYFVNDVPLIIRINDIIYPSLIFEDAISDLPYIVVDVGAVSYICNGADVMIPGIRKINGEIKKGSTVLICDEKYNKKLALGISLYDEKEIRRMKKGKVITSVHYVGDEIWQLISDSISNKNSF